MEKVPPFQHSKTTSERSEDTTPSCKVTPVILHGVVSPETPHLTAPQTPLQVLMRINDETRVDDGSPRFPIFGEFNNRLGCRPVLEVKNKDKVIYSSLNPEEGASALEPPKFCFEGEDEVMVWRVGRTLMGDVTVTCYHVELKENDDIDFPGLPTNEVPLSRPEVDGFVPFTQHANLRKVRKYKVDSDQ